MKLPFSAPLSRRDAMKLGFFTTGIGFLAHMTAAQARTIISSEPIGAGVGKIEADKKILAQNINFETFIVDTDPSTIALECIDGRKKSFASDAPVGAKLAGGAVSLQAAYAIIGKPMSDSETLQIFGNKPGQVPYIPGGHIDRDHSLGGADIVNPDVPGTGCGASDKLTEILQLFKTDGKKLGGVVSQVLGSDFDATIFDSLIAKTLETVPHDPKSLASRFAAQQRGGLDVLDSGENHPKNHNHHESFVIFNNKKGKTFDNNLFQKDYPDTQAFSVDLWVLKEIAQYLFPKDEKGRKEYLHALVAYQVATYYALTNGSQKAVFIS